VAQGHLHQVVVADQLLWLVLTARRRGSESVLLPERIAPRPRQLRRQLALQRQTIPAERARHGDCGRGAALRCDVIAQKKVCVPPRRPCSRSWPPSARRCRPVPATLLQRRLCGVWTPATETCAHGAPLVPRPPSVGGHNWLQHTPPCRAARCTHAAVWLCHLQLAGSTAVAPCWARGALRDGCRDRKGVWHCLDDAPSHTPTTLGAAPPPSLGTRPRTSWWVTRAGRTVRLHALLCPKRPWEIDRTGQWDHLHLTAQKQHQAKLLQGLCVEQHMARVGREAVAVGAAPALGEGWSGVPVFGPPEGGRLTHPTAPLPPPPLCACTPPRLTHALPSPRREAAEEPAEPDAGVAKP
jgi:hypothetical protein